MERILTTVALVFFAAVTLAAQWPKQPTAGLPRLADGSPDLKAPAPRLPDGRIDLTGIWATPVGRTYQGIAGKFQHYIAADLGDLPLLPSALKLFEARKAMEGRNHPRVQCFPRGIPNAMVWSGGPFKILHTPGVTVMLFEEFVTYRQIFTDARSLPVDAQPTWWGYSVGRWVGDSFVVESNGFKEGGWLDFFGTPASDAMKIIETYTRKTVGQMDIEFRFEDAKTYSRPWAVTVDFTLMPDTEFIEHVCENERTYERLTGAAK